MSILRYIDCENADDDLLSLIKRTIVQDDEGNWYFRVTEISDEDLPISLISEIECGDTDSLLDLLRNMLFIDTETGNLSWAVYNVSE